MSVARQLMVKWLPRNLKTRLRKIRRQATSGITSNYTVLSRLSVWQLNSTNWWLYPHLTIDNANSYPESLMRLHQTINDGPIDFDIDKIEDFGCANPELTKALYDLFRLYGSDKSTVHDYFRYYADCLYKLGQDKELSILEIGLGSNEPSLVSTMGRGGKPGASVRAFRDVVPNGRIYGADIDKRTLFSEDRIRTSYVDQLDPKSFDDMVTNLGETRFDLIIDDGLHSVQANLNTLMFSLEHLQSDGVCVIEDIPERSLTAWMPVVWILRGQPYGIIKCKSAYLFWIRKA